MSATTNFDRLKAMCQLGLNRYSLFRLLRDANQQGRDNLALTFGRHGDTRQFCDDVAGLYSETTFAAAVTAENIDDEAQLGVSAHLFRKENGWVQERFSRSYWSKGTHSVEVCGFEYRIAGDDGQFQEVAALEMLRFLNSLARKVVVA